MRGAVFTFLVGLVVMVGWLWQSGLPPCGRRRRR
jgi:hypothetical protein